MVESRFASCRIDGDASSERELCINAPQLGRGRPVVATRCPAIPPCAADNSRMPAVDRHRRAVLEAAEKRWFEFLPVSLGRVGVVKDG